MTREEIEEMAGDTVLLFLGSEDGEFDRAIIGITERAGRSVLVYDEELILETLVSQGMTYEDSVEWYEFNIACAFMGKSTPIYVKSIKNNAPSLVT